ncbi:MAG: class IV adenylate cyclase [Pirellulales bacterium]
MPSNVEIKARSVDFQRQKALAAEIADGPSELVVQRDTFFNAPHGRLKLREFADGNGQLIQYARPNQTTAKVSSYTLVTVPDPESMRLALAASLGIRGEVRKRRWLFLAGQTRIHLDEVEQLGHFIELEVVMRSNQPTAEGEAIAHEFVQRLGITPADLIETAYIDLAEA